MVLKFTKMEGLGNDFMVIDATEQAFTLSAAQIQQLANRRYGVGFDQLLVIDANTRPGIDFNYQIFNADGSKAEQCGNGARCIGQYIFEQKLSSKHKLLIQAPKSIIEIWPAENNEIIVSLDQPRFAPEQLPLALEHLAGPITFAANSPTTSLPIYPIKINHTLTQCYIVNIGNPHAIILAEKDDLEKIALIGEQLNQHPCFPEGVNVSMVKIVNRNHLFLTVYERGAGLTPACGSAACASAVIAIKQNWTESPVKVTQTGGTLLVRWENDHQPLLMQGPARTIYHGELSSDFE